MRGSEDQKWAANLQPTLIRWEGRRVSQFLSLIAGLKIWDLVTDEIKELSNKVLSERQWKSENLKITSSRPCKEFIPNLGFIWYFATLTKLFQLLFIILNFNCIVFSALPTKLCIVVCALCHLIYRNFLSTWNKIQINKYMNKQINKETYK